MRTRKVDIMTRRRRSGGFLLAAILVVMALLAIVLGALLTRQQTGHAAARFGEARAQARYESLGTLNMVLAKVEQGMTPATAAAQVTAATGTPVLAAGDRLLVDDGVPVQARLQPQAFKHVMFAQALALSGANGAFEPDDPHGPAIGTPPAPEAGFRSAWQARAAEGGVLLTAQASEGTFRPGGGAWQKDTWMGQASWLYLGGGAGDDYGWVPGVHRWTLTAANRWSSSTGESLTLSGGTWTWQGDGRLAGPLMVDGASLLVRDDLQLEGTVVVWGGALEVRQAHLTVSPGSASTLGLAVLAGTSETEDPEPWSTDKASRPGDLLLVTGNSHLSVGDRSDPEATGALVLAQNRVVKNGSEINLAGVMAAGLLDLNGVPAGDYVWSGRVSRNAPLDLNGGDLSLAETGRVEAR